MSFATPQDVKDLFRHFADSSEAAVTDAKLQKWLDSEHEFILGKVGTLYQLPITAASNPKTAAILADIEAMLVASKVDDILNSYSEADKKPQWYRNAIMRLKEYVPDKDKEGKQGEPTVRLPDATYNGTRSQKGQLKVSSTNTPTFTKGGDNW
jgi:hypothetical protein